MTTTTDKRKPRPLRIKDWHWQQAQAIAEEKDQPIGRVIEDAIELMVKERES